MPMNPPGAGENATLERLASSPGLWIVAGFLLLVAVYVIIRLLELDLVNEETPNQEEPLPR